MNAAGAYHDFDLSKDSNAFFDPATGMVAWDTTDPGGSGYQEGWLNAENFFNNMDRDESVSIDQTGDVYTAGQVGDYLSAMNRKVSQWRI